MDAEQEKIWAMFCHLASLAWIPLTVVGLAIPFTNLIAPALIWFLKKEESEMIDQHGKESLNFQISMTIYGLSAFAVLVVIMLIGIVIGLAIGATEGNPVTVLFGLLAGLGVALGIITIAAIAIFQLVVVIFAAIKAKDGEMYRYPFTLRIL